MTNKVPKAIDTHYNGYRFRSRTEARWAVFFDELHIAYAYEPQGFELAGVRYLPDFQLTEGLILHQFGPAQPAQIWVEIKPDSELSNTERTKLVEFLKQTNHHVLLIAGQPDINTTLRFIDYHPETGWLVVDVRWIELQNGQIGLVPVDKLNNNDLLSRTNTPRLRYALDKARQARFEFGQTPKPPPRQKMLNKAPPVKVRAGTKLCELCGEEFKPHRSHLVRCLNCSGISAPLVDAAPEEQPYPETQTRVITGKKYGVPLLLVLLITLIVGGFIAVNQGMLGKYGNPSGMIVPARTSVSATDEPALPDGLVAAPAGAKTWFAVWDFENETRVASMDLTGNATASARRGLSGESFVAGNPDGTRGKAWSFIHWAFASSPDSTRYVEFKVDMSNYQDLSLSLAERRSNTGPLAFEIHYSTDGVNFTQIASTVTVPNNTDWRMHTFDLTSLNSQIAGQPAVRFRIYGYNTGTASGTWRLDDVIFMGE